MDKIQIIITTITAIIPALISYFIARYQGKTDIKKLKDNNAAEINKLIKQHEINLEAIKEQHKLEMEAKEKEQQYKLELMQKEYELKIHENQQTKTNDVMTNALGGIFGSIMNDPATAMEKINSLKELGEKLNQNKGQ